jgi:hypothetical protein
MVFGSNTYGADVFASQVAAVILLPKFPGSVITSDVLLFAVSGGNSGGSLAASDVLLFAVSGDNRAGSLVASDRRL